MKLIGSAVATLLVMVTLISPLLSSPSTSVAKNPNSTTIARDRERGRESKRQREGEREGERERERECNNLRAS